MINKLGLWGAVCLWGLCSYAARAGVTVEGESSGIAPVASVAYHPENNRFVFDGGTILRNPVTREEMREIVHALRLDDRMGVAAKNDNSLMVYGELAPEGSVVKKLQAADNFLRAVVFGERSRLQGITLPEAYSPQSASSRERASVFYLNLDGVNYRHAEGAYWAENHKADLVLIPMAKHTAADGSYVPDYDALEKGEMQKEDAENAAHIRNNVEAYLELPPLRALVKISEAAAVVRHLRASGVDLAVFEKKLEQGTEFALAVSRNSNIPEAGEPVTAPNTANNGANDAAAELEQQKLFSENVKRVLSLDNAYSRENAVKMTRNTVNDGSYVEFRRQYLQNLRSVSQYNVPKDLQQAYAAHAAAWEKTLNWLATQKIADTPEAFDAFKNAHAPYRAELGATYRQCKQIAAAYLK